MKKLILGLDGMDFRYATEFGLNNVLQLDFSTIKVPISKKYNQPLSPEVWGSFLCAEHIVFSFEGPKHFEVSKFLAKLKKLFPFISFGLGRKVCGQITGFPKIDRKTWIDLPNVKEINAPFYSYSNEVFSASRRFSSHKDLDVYRKDVGEIFVKDSKKILDELSVEVEKGSSDVVFAYTHFPDLFNHVWFTEELSKLEKLYKKIDAFTGSILRLLQDTDTHVIIVSDHGFDFEKGHHSNLGFISSNKFMNFPKNIVGLGKMIENFARN